MANPMASTNSGMEFRFLGPGQLEDFIGLVRVFEEEFEMKGFRMPGPSHLSRVLASPDFRACVALKDSKIIGGATVYTLHQYYSERPLAYIYDVAVLNLFQRKGIGSRMIQFIIEKYRSEGYEEVFVQADETDGYALDFYRSTNPTEEEKVRHFYYK